MVFFRFFFFFLFLLLFFFFIGPKEKPYDAVVAWATEISVWEMGGGSRKSEGGDSRSNVRDDGSATAEAVTARGGGWEQSQQKGCDSRYWMQCKRRQDNDSRDSGG